MLWIWRKSGEHESSFHDYVYSDARAKKLMQTMANNIHLLEYASLNPHDKQRIDFENGIWKDYPRIADFFNEGHDQ